MNTVDEDLDKLEKKLDQYSSSLGLDKILYNTEVDDVLLMDLKTLRNLDKQGCEEFSYLLAQHAAIVALAINREVAKLVWADDELNKAISKNYSNYKTSDYEKFELIKYKIINQNTQAARLNTIIVDIKSKRSQLFDLSLKLENMSRILNSISRNK